jgi:hypothetical protein
MKVPQTIEELGLDDTGQGIPLGPTTALANIPVIFKYLI